MLDAPEGAVRLTQANGLTLGTRWAYRLYPTLRREDVTAVMAYAAELVRERVVMTIVA
jgi:hypothetical protein